MKLKEAPYMQPTEDETLCWLQRETAKLYAESHPEADVMEAIAHRRFNQLKDGRA